MNSHSARQPQKVTLIRDSIVILHNYFNLLHAILQPWDEFVIITKKNVGLTAQYYYNVNITLRNCHSKYILFDRFLTIKLMDRGVLSQFNCIASKLNFKSNCKKTFFSQTFFFSQAIVGS